MPAEEDTVSVHVIVHDIVSLREARKLTSYHRTSLSPYFFLETTSFRCDIITDSDPPICQHCSQYRYDCTFYLPITETRFKKKRMEEAAANSNGSNVDVKPVISRGHSGDEPPTNGLASGSRVRGDVTMANAGESSKEVKIYGKSLYRVSVGFESLRAVFGCGKDAYLSGKAGMAWQGPAHHHRRPQSSLGIRTDYYYWAMLTLSFPPSFLPGSMILERAV